MNNPRKKIAIMHFAYPPNIGGVEVLMQEHAQILSNHNFEVTIITGSGKSLQENIQLIEIPELQSIMNFNAELQNNIFKGIFDKEFDTLTHTIREKLEEVLQPFDTIIVHNMMTVSRNLAFTKAFAEYCKTTDKNIIVYIHDHMYVKGNGLNLDAKKSDVEEKLITQRIPHAKYVAISEVLKTQLLKVLPLDNSEIHIVPNGIYLSAFLEIDDQIQKLLFQDKILDKFPIILSPVNIVRRKNLLYSIQIINELKKTYPTILYVITGNTSNHFDSEGYLKEMLDLIHKYNLESNVLFMKDTFKRMLKISEMHDLYSICDSVFFFSESENFGLPLLEAGIMRKPIFVSNLEIFKEVGKEFITTIDTTQKNYSEVAQKIISVLEKDESQFFYRVKSQYGLSKIVTKYLIPLIQ